MTTETRQRIRAYKRMLPELRERVIAVALLFAMSVSMLGTASYAWLTLSRAPEVKGMSTTVAANGNLEIALAQGSTSKAAEKPLESEVGDSAAAQGITNANITWGNLINLSDPIYGISNIALRPASLSSSDRTVAPLYGANYGDDGRVKNVLANYQYASWKLDKNGKGYFDARSINYGVRAITSVKFDNVSANEALASYWEYINGEQGHYQLARTGYERIIDNEEDVGGMKSMDALSYIISLYAKDQVAGVLKNEPNDDYGTCITYLYNIMVKFQQIMEHEGEMLRQIANLQIFLKENGAKGSEYFKTLDEFMSMSASELVALKVNLTSYETLKSNYDTIVKYTDPESPDSIYQMAVDYDQNNPDKAPKTDKIPWTTIEPLVSKVVNINQTYLNGNPVTGLANLGYSELLGLAMGSGHKVEIRAGIIKDVEARLGVTAASKNIKMTIETGIKNVTASVSTNAAPNEDGYFKLDQDIKNARDLQGGSEVQGTDPVAKDTYGMAFDLWFRTNAVDSILTLEGHTLTTEEPIMVTDEDGEEYPLYTLTINGQTCKAYKKDGKWYAANNHEQIDSNLIQKEDAEMEMRVTGFEGENRIWGNDSSVWDDMVHDGHILQDRTTQGAGSCFVFYANPSEQNSIMKMLEAFKIFFMDDRGRELGRASLITQNAYTINGKVTVPIEVTASKVEYTKLDENSVEKTYKGITRLTENEPMHVTAIVYLEGDDLDNQKVLSAGEIEGQLNLQFGSSAQMSSIDDTELQQQYRTVTAEANYNGETSIDESSAIVGGQNSKGLPYDGKPKKIGVTVNVEGDQPTSISGFFVRSINATQGTREETKTFTKGADGTWTAEFELTKPGKYMLRSVIVDGVEYPLIRMTTIDGIEMPTPAYPTVIITGLDISDLTVTNSKGVVTSGEYMTADDRWPVTITARINASDDLMPKNVRAVFMGDQQEFNAIMTYEDGVWTGSTNITRSGTYSLSFMVLDTDYVSISGPTVTLKLGMTAKVWADPANATKIVEVDGKEETINAELTSTEFEFKDGDKIQMPVTVEIFNDLEQEQEDLNGNLRLIFHDGTGTDAYGLSTDLDWNGDRYEGTFMLDEVGSYTFNRVEIQLAGSSDYSEVRKALFAPRISPTSPYPPEYNSDLTENVQLIAETKETATIDVILPYGSAFVEATLENNGREYPGVRGTIYGNPTDVVTKSGKTAKANTYRFEIPETNQYSGQSNVYTQDGLWKIKTLHFWGVYVDGQLYPSPAEGQAWDVSESYSFDVPDAESTYVIETLTAVLTRGVDAQGKPKTYTGENLGFPEGWKLGDAFDTQNATATFMEPKKIAPVTVKIVDWNNQLVEGVEAVQWQFTYAGTDGTTTQTSETYGGYTTANERSQDFVWELTSANADGAFITTEDFGVAAAGKFTGTIKADFKDAVENDAFEWRDTRLNSNIVILSASRKPVLSIPAISPSGLHSTVNQNKQQIEIESKIVGNTVTIYPEATAGGCSGSGELQTAPQVTLRLDHLGEYADQAVLEFTTDNTEDMYMYAASGRDQTSDYTWNQTTKEEVTRFIGYYGGSCTDAKPAGTLTSADKLRLTAGGTDYYVAVPVITIINVAP